MWGFAVPADGGHAAELAATAHPPRTCCQEYLSGRLTAAGNNIRLYVILVNFLKMASR